MSQHGRVTRIAPRFHHLLVLTVFAAVVACRDDAPTDAAPAPLERRDGLDRARAVGRALPHLTRDQRRRFEAGSIVFQRVFTPETGLGPLFNADGCATCHGLPAVGGVGPQIETHATAFEGGVCEDFDEINGGSVVQSNVTPLLFAALGITEEPLPPLATGAGRRTTPDLFGFGLLDAIPEAEILRRADPEDRDHDGISGRANRGEEGVVGRFGRKAGVTDLVDFITDAFIYEQGVTSEDEPEEQTIVGTPLPDGVDPAPDPEVSEEDLEAAIAFVRFLAPPAPGALTGARLAGRRLFGRIGCADCHVPALRTGPNPVAALSRRTVAAYTDLLLHDMGPDLADICGGEATPSEFRTEPLMGVRFSATFLHDGRAQSIEGAIRWHGGEAERAQRRFARLGRRDRTALLAFVGSL